MGKIIKEIEIEGQPAVVLFDTGATHTYVEKGLAMGIPVISVLKPYRVGLCGSLQSFLTVVSRF